MLMVIYLSLFKVITTFCRIHSVIYFQNMEELTHSLLTINMLISMEILISISSQAHMVHCYTVKDHHLDQP